MEDLNRPRISIALTEHQLKTIRGLVLNAVQDVMDARLVSVPQRIRELRPYLNIYDCLTRALNGFKQSQSDD